MGRKSTKENKNIYQTTREELELTRAQAAELLECISEDKIENFELGQIPSPEDVLIMAEKYKKPELLNHYCTRQCRIGEKYIPEIEKKELPQITLEVLSTLNSLEEKRNRMIEIAADGNISDEEIEDFTTIKNQLDDLSAVIGSLSLWVANAITKGQMSNIAETE